MKRHERKSNTRGFSLIELMIVIAVIGLLIGIGVPAWKYMVESGNETSAQQILDRVRTAQIQHAAKKSGNYGTFPQLVEATGMDDQYKAEEPVINGYKFVMKITPRSSTAPAFYSISAEPLVKGGVQSTGSRFFYTDSSLSAIKVNENQPATAADPAIGQ